jgi:hypothetical protein
MGNAEGITKMTNTYILVRKPEEKMPLGKPVRRCEGNINMNLQDLAC